MSYSQSVFTCPVIHKMQLECNDVITSNFAASRVYIHIAMPLSKSS